MVALAHEQAQDHLAEAPLIRQRNLEKAQPYRRRTHGADHRRFNSDRLVFLFGLEHETQERSPRQAGRLEGAAIHRNVRNPIGRPYPIVCQELRLDRGGKPFVLPAIGRLSTAGRFAAEGMKLVHAELAAERNHIEVVQHTFHHPRLRCDADERRSAVRTMESLHALDFISASGWKVCSLPGCACCSVNIGSIIAGE